MELPDRFPEGTKFGVWEDIPLSREPDLFTLAWDSDKPRRILSSRFDEIDKLLTEMEFRALVRSNAAA